MTMLSISIPRNQQDLQKDLESLVGKQVRLELHQNHSTLISIQPEFHFFDVKLHSKFTLATQQVLESLAAYMLGKRGPETIQLKRFVHEEVCSIDLSATAQKKELIHQGKIWNLLDLYHDIEKRFFPEPLNLSITWFGKRTRKSASTRLTLGLYYDMLKLIKMHVLLDVPHVPEYVIEFILYHEMIHSVCPAEISPSGKVLVHTKKFQELEERYPWHNEAESWLHNNIQLLFNTKQN